MDMFPKSEDSCANLIGKVLINVIIRQFDRSDPYASSVIESAWFEGEPLICVKAPKKMQQAGLGLTINEFFSLADKLGFTCGIPRRFTADGVEEVNIQSS